MFRNKSAWFSSSAPQSCRDFWALQGGVLEGWRTADYLFSTDATCPDTMRIFESRDYLWSKVVVFHCLFLSTCQKRDSVTSVCIGHYVLPPPSVQEEVRKVVGRLIWEREDEQAVTRRCVRRSGGEGTSGSRRTPDSSSPESSESPLAPQAHVHHYPAGDGLTGYVSMDNLPKYIGELCDFRPACLRCGNSRPGCERTCSKRKAC